MVKSSKDGMLFQLRRWSIIALSNDGLTFLNVKDDIPICFQNLTFKYPSQRNRKNWTFHTYIYKPLQILTKSKSKRSLNWKALAGLL